MYTIKKGKKEKFKKKKKIQAIRQPQVVRANKALRGVWLTRNLIWELKSMLQQKKTYYILTFEEDY